MVPEPRVLTDFPNTHLLVCAALLLLLGTGLLATGSLSWTALTSVASVILLGDAALALLIHPVGTAEDHPALTWLTPVWKVNLAVTAAIVLAQVFRPSLLATTVTMVMLAMTGGFWLAAFVVSRGPVRWAVLGWVSAFLLTGALVRMAPVLASGPAEAIPVSLAGVMAIMLALWILWWARPLRNPVP